MKLKYFLIILFYVLEIQCESLKVHRPKTDWAYLENWDKNGNESLDIEEFVAGYNELDFFGRWDQESESISDSVFSHRTFEFLDRNHDNALDSVEYSSRRVTWSFHGGIKRLKKWDVNQDKLLAFAEFMHKAQTEHLSQGFDQTSDGQITASEMAQGMFEVCDKNNDDKVSGLEFYLWELYRQR